MYAHVANMSELTPWQEAFDSAKDDFRKGLKNEKLFKNVLEKTSINEVWKMAEELQAKQDAEKRLRHMGKIRDFLAKLDTYTSTVNIFVNAKPEAMSLIWGPIHLLMRWTANIADFADAIGLVMMEIGEALPRVIEVAGLFTDKERIRDVLVLFFKDILDSYTIMLKFFSMSRTRIIFESAWPRHKGKIDVVIENIKRHTTLMRDEVTVEHFKAEHEARTRALEHFDKETKFREVQSLQTLKAHISPQTYGPRLDWVLNRSSKGSVNWLLSDKTFLQWLDVSTDIQLLWLRGIPGAGKTFLSAAAIAETRKLHHTLFVFASHENDITAKSIILSLLFQLAAHDEQACSMLVQSNELELSGSTEYASELLKSLLENVGATYIILDGVDEMETVERRILLEQLVSLESLSSVKILIGCRDEDDIKKILEAKATGIHVNQRNSGSIQSYVNQEMQKWLDNEDFLEAAREKIQSLLAPVAANADGMFLYARIVLDNVKLLTDPEEIERELRALPSSLDEAYHRIFARINDSPPLVRQKTRMIIGWIGGAPVSMTRHEMEQALLVGPGSRAAPQVVASINFVRLCGPIVEVVDEFPRFVHFTVKEYIFDWQIADFINKSDANYALAKSSLMYLRSELFDVTISDEELQDNILTGKYRLHWFATKHWIDLIRVCVEESEMLSAYPDLFKLLGDLPTKIENPSYAGQPGLSGNAFQSIEKEWPEISGFINGTLKFRQDERQSDWNFSNSRTWVDHDPSILSYMSARIHKQIDQLVCNDRVNHLKPCHCEILRRHYGVKLFKCNFPSCSLNRQGFSTFKERMTHINHHSRPWKCSVPECPYADIGFITVMARDSHWRERHLVSPPLDLLTSSSQHFSDDDVQVLLYELTKRRDVNGLRELMQQLLSEKRHRLYAVFPAIRLAATLGSLPMVQILTQGDDWPRIFPENEQFGAAVLQSENAALFRWWLDQISIAERFETYKHLARDAFVTNSRDVYAEWEDFLIDPARQLAIGLRSDGDVPSMGHTKRGVEAQKLIPQSTKRVVLFSKQAFDAARKSPVFEARIIQTWHRLIDKLGGRPLNPNFLGWSLTCLGRLPRPSIPLATELLRLGAPIDFPRGYIAPTLDRDSSTGEMEPGLEHTGPRRRRGITTLHHAIRLGGSEQAALLARFLLERGADPSYGYAGVKPEQESGAKWLKHWLGETLEEMVERTLIVRIERKSIALGPGTEYDTSSEEENVAPQAKRPKRTDLGDRA